MNVRMLGYAIQYRMMHRATSAVDSRRPPQCPCCSSWEERRRRQPVSTTAAAITSYCAEAVPAPGEWEDDDDDGGGGASGASAASPASGGDDMTRKQQRSCSNNVTAAAAAEKFGDYFVLRNAQVFTLNDTASEEACGAEELDVWIGGGKIWALTPPSRGQPQVGCCPTIPNLLEVDAAGLTIVPGLVDLHQHVSGGGGEAGFGSRTPEAASTAASNDLIEAGVTTFVATLGTDTATRSMEQLIAKTRSLVQLQASGAGGGGLTGLVWLGGYSFPIENTITGSVRRDVTLLPEVVGVGELAVSDHRGSYPTADELLRLVSEVRVAGLLSGKCGVTYFHLGEDESGLQPLCSVVERNPVLRKHMVPTHLERTPQLIEEGMEWMRAGGLADFSGWPERQRPAIRTYCQTEQGRKLIRRQLSISSDSYGSINVFDQDGKLLRHSYGRPSALLRTFLALVYEDNVPIDTALRFFCRNPAAVIRLDGAPRYKGRIRVGGDADLLVLKLPPRPLPADYPRTAAFGMDWPSTNGILQYVIAGGRVLKAPPAS